MPFIIGLAVGISTVVTGVLYLIARSDRAPRPSKIRKRRVSL